MTKKRTPKMMQMATITLADGRIGHFVGEVLVEPSHDVRRTGVKVKSVHLSEPYEVTPWREPFRIPQDPPSDN